MDCSVMHRLIPEIVGRTFALAAAICFSGLIEAASSAEPATVDFNRDIRPILSDNCFECHGPDAEQRQAELRLDTHDGLFRKPDGYSSVVPGSFAKSELFRRITSADPDEIMPPSDSGRMLTVEQISAIKMWIESGADWQQHWSFVAPARPKLPQVSNADWVKNPVDAFILARLDQEGLKPSEPTDKRTLLRRVSFDLTGLPPTLDEIDEFLKDDSPNAYERIVDRLLKSPRYAERMTIRWLDAARYADTNGYQTDGPRDMWRWRDWVIEAFRQNMPFDQFTIEQLAGDLLPDATLDQKIATGFNRNHRGNAEGGIVPEEFQVEYVVDRVDTTFTVWQGLTMGCARCHSHKFDPISQKEYYQLFACFNNIPENGRALKEGNSPPWILAPTLEQVAELSRLNGEYTAAMEQFDAVSPRLQKQFTKWRNGGWKMQQDLLPDNWQIDRQLHLHAPLDSVEATLVDSDTSDSEQVSTSEFGSMRFAAGRVGNAIELDGRGLIEIPEGGKFGYFDRFSISAHVLMPELRSGTIVSKMELIDRGAGYNLHIASDGKVQLNLVKRWLDDSLRVETIDAIPTGRWVHLLATYDGTRTSDSIRIFIDGIEADRKVNLDGINQSFESDEPVRIGAGNSNFYGFIDEVRIYDRVIEDAEVSSLAEPRSIKELLAVSVEDTSPLALDKLTYYFSRVGGPESLISIVGNADQTRSGLFEFRRVVPTVMVMQEMQTPRETHVLQRGQYDRPGERVTFDTPAALPPLPENTSKDRLGLARWLVSRDNPLTARVIVNRFWRDIFGTGIVKTTEDFGVQGERPSHPELLDWLAVEFMESGWDVKRLIRTIVTSNAYRQTSRSRNAESGSRNNSDPENRLLARGPRGRLSAEMIRDQALLASGMLTEKLGGPSVRPYQPEGLLKEIASDTTYEQDHGPDLYRRSLYTYWKRTVAPPMMANFDAAGREFCEVRQTRTNTPLQALNLLNDVTFVEAARVLAQNTLSKCDNDEQRLDRIFERLLSRLPSDRERAILLAGLSHHRDRFAKNEAAAKVLVQTGEWPMTEELHPAELAAWTTICSTVINLDEAVTKE
tara:strand:+ start:85538 stop:88756 length:3219 start_codon:yes stop_codon:yes gene_type:complete